MAMPTVETFEHDIANEIRHKEASITDIVTATNDIGNIDDSIKKNNTPLIIIVALLTMIGILGVGAIGYFYYTGNVVQKPASNQIVTESSQSKKNSSLSSISPSIDNAIGSFLTNPQKTKDGYSITINSYSPVFAYMLKNEKAFGSELGLAVGNNHTIKKSDLVIPVSTTTLATSTKPVTGSSSATTNQGTSSPVLATSSPETKQELTEEYVFSDITMSNQNMRVGTSVFGTVVYAFVGVNHLLIASSPSGILTLRGNILKK